MAFSIFSKPPPPSPSGKAGPRPAAGKTQAKRPPKGIGLADIQRKEGTALGHFTVTRYGTAAERAKAASLAVPEPDMSPMDLGLPPGLENAVLMFAGGQAAKARQVLADALVNEPDSRALALAWYAQFDLLQRANDRAAFDQLALDYVSYFERSPPPWDEARIPTAKSGTPGAGYFALTQVNVKTALEIPARAASHATLRIDVATLTIFEDTGCRRLVDVLRRLRRQAYPVGWQGLDALWRRIDEKIGPGRKSNEGLWLFALELLQWQNNQAQFEERAIDYAVTFEVSPPSWEPLARKQEQAATQTQPARRDCYVFKGVMQGPADPQIAVLVEFAEPRGVVHIDLSQVERIDFVCAGALQNAISKIVGDEKEVQIAGATPIVHAMLTLIGIDPEHFKIKYA